MAVGFLEKNYRRLEVVKVAGNILTRNSGQTMQNAQKTRPMSYAAGFLNVKAAFKDAVRQFQLKQQGAQLEHARSLAMKGQEHQWGLETQQQKHQQGLQTAQFKQDLTPDDKFLELAKDIVLARYGGTKYLAPSKEDMAGIDLGQEILKEYNKLMGKGSQPDEEGRKQIPQDEEGWRKVLGAPEGKLSAQRMVQYLMSMGISEQDAMQKILRQMLLGKVKQK